MNDKFSENEDILNNILSETDPDAAPVEEALDYAEENEELYSQNDMDAEMPEEAREFIDAIDEEYLENTEAEEPESVPLPGEGRKKPAGKAPEKKKKKKKKKHNSRLPGVLILVTLIFGVSIISSIVIIGFGKDMLGIGKSENTHMIVVPEGATNQQIADMLEQGGIIKSAKAFKLFADLRNKDLAYISGEHFIRPNMAYETIINELTVVPEVERGESVQVTFPEGINLIEASNILEENGICDAEEFVFYFNSGGYGVPFEDLLPIDTALKFQRMEGYLFPDTYFFYENSTPAEVCQKIYYNFDQKMTDERLDRMEELGLTLDQLVTFASVVQKEAATTDTMNRVASVFWNRLEDTDNFGSLQSDPTTNYANNVIRPNMQYFDQVKIDAYDTYKTPGLPPGAICNPGIEAIDAVLEKYESDYYFFIANIHTKVTYFSETLEEHEAYQAEIEEYYEQEGLDYEE
ncbi:MAG: endolytic transglycosylase MltG [Alistipes sp.]|nr:endolytic transglycosylase MltG [Alistipes sp.]